MIYFKYLFQRYQMQRFYASTLRSRGTLTRALWLDILVVAIDSTYISIAAEPLGIKQ